LFDEQVLYSVDTGRTDPILAAVGQLQFEVVQYRMQSEYGVETQLEPLSFSVARWVTGGWPALEKVGRIYNCATVKDQVREFLARNFNMLVEEVNTLGSICWHHASILHLTVVYHMEFEQVVLIPSQSNHKFES
jgi:peptide subunit release factor RF-3